MNRFRNMIRFGAVALIMLPCLGCAEAKIGAGPFKALSMEVGPGGVEAKGPSAGPFKLFGAERDWHGERKDD